MSKDSLMKINKDYNRNQPHINDDDDEDEYLFNNISENPLSNSTNQIDSYKDSMMYKVNDTIPENISSSMSSDKNEPAQVSQ